MPKYYKGNYYEDYEKEYDEHKGWLVGEFMECFRKTKAVEIKFWEFGKNEIIDHEKKLQCRAIECTFILSGKVRGEIDNEEVFLCAGDYVVIPPRVSNNFPIEILENAEGITIKAPSDKIDKITEKHFNPRKSRGNSNNKKITMPINEEFKQKFKETLDKLSEVSEERKAYYLKADEEAFDIEKTREIEKKFKETNKEFLDVVEKYFGFKAEESGFE